ncbi:MAG: hypothetical protein DRJ60_02455 [Thermoprotei archaeon]|nr:MAG: hypothetical protein DRJ60_02455 [Thermoprotei archaeon]
MHIRLSEAPTMTKTPPFFFAFKRHTGVSEIIAAIILFTITLTISSLSIAFLSQRASIASKSITSDVQRATLKSMATIKLIDVVQLDNESIIVLYNPSDIKIKIAAIIVGGFSQRVNKVMEPMSITQLNLSMTSQSLPRDEIYVLTSEGVLIHVKT